MNNDLIKRIDDFLVEFGLSTKEWDLLNDCRAEIELLSQVNESLRNQNTALDEILAEYSERKYVPMTDNQIDTITLTQWRNSNVAPPAEHRAYVRAIEAAVIKRLGLEIKHD